MFYLQHCFRQPSESPFLPSVSSCCSLCSLSVVRPKSQYFTVVRARLSSGMLPARQFAELCYVQVRPIRGAGARQQFRRSGAPGAWPTAGGSCASPLQTSAITPTRTAPRSTLREALRSKQASSELFWDPVSGAWRTARTLGSTLVSATLAESLVVGGSVEPMQFCSSAAPSASTDAFALAELCFANAFRTPLVFKLVFFKAALV